MTDDPDHDLNHDPTDDLNDNMDDDLRHDRNDGSEAVTDLTDAHDRLRTDLGGYVLGSLTLAEQQAVEAHLEGCAECRAELVELEGIPVLLDLAQPTFVAGESPAPSGPLAAPRPAAITGRPAPVTALPTGARSHRSRRRRTLAGVAATLAVAAALFVGVLIGQADEPDFGPAIALQPVAAATDAPSGTAALRATEHGTAVRLDLEGLPTEGTWYECTWSSGQGEQSAGTFRPDPDGSVSIDLTTAARLYPGWKLAIVEHPDGAAHGDVVLEASAS